MNNYSSTILLFLDIIFLVVFYSFVFFGLLLSEIRYQFVKHNLDKTEFFILCSPYHQSRLNDLVLQLDDTVILPSATVRNLGVTFDRNMTMTQHVTNLCQKCELAHSQYL